MFGWNSPYQIEVLHRGWIPLHFSQNCYSDENWYYLFIILKIWFSIHLLIFSTDCPQYKMFIRRRCNPKTKHYVLSYKRAYQIGCKCYVKCYNKKGHYCCKSHIWNLFEKYQSSAFIYSFTWMNTRIRYLHGSYGVWNFPNSLNKNINLQE